MGTTETPPEGFVGTSSIAADAIDNTKIADNAIKRENIDDITDIKQVKEGIKVFKHFKEVEQIDVWIDVRYNPITNKENK